MNVPVHALAVILALSVPFLRAATPADGLRAELGRAAPVIDVRGGAVPGTVLATGPRAVPLASGLAAGLPAPVAAATTVGRGRVVAIGHTAFFERKSMDEVPDNAVFLEHALRWLAGGRAPARIWLDDKLRNLKDPLAAPSRAVETVAVPAGLAALPKGAVVVLAPDWHALADVPAVRSFLVKGGAALCPVIGWGWHQVSGGKSFRTESPFNALLAADGLATDGRCQARSCDRGFETAPDFGPVLDFLGRWQADPVRAWPARPEAADFPGVPPPGSPRLARTVAIDLSVPRWHGTGLFAAAGEKLTVQLPPGAEKKGLRLRIGSTTCRLVGKKKLQRPPVVDLEVPLETRTLTLASPFGGLVYVVVPKGLSGRVDVKLGPACPAPTYTLGKTTPEAWRKRRALPAPMAELATDKVILTVPSEVIRDLDDPAPLLKTWDRVMDLDAKLTAISPVRESPERFCCDVQLCAGFMHAGYPIMIPTGSAKHLVDNAGILAGKDVWGLFHEMGHNHQNRDWTFDGTGEVTVNFFTLYCLRHLCGQTSRQTRMGESRLAEKVRKWNDAGRPLDEWKKDPFLALDFFVRLEEKYGWEAFEELFAEYRALKPSERPKNDREKRRQWCERLSRIAGEDLSAEFAFLLRD